MYILNKGNLFPQGINDFIQIAALVNCFNSRDRVTYRTFRKSIFKSRQARLPPFFPPASIRKAFPTPSHAPIMSCLGISINGITLEWACWFAGKLVACFYLISTEQNSALETHLGTMHCTSKRERSINLIITVHKSSENGTIFLNYKSEGIIM